MKNNIKNNNITYIICLIKTYFVCDIYCFKTLRKTFNLHLNLHSSYNT